MFVEILNPPQVDCGDGTKHWINRNGSKILSFGPSCDVIYIHDGVVMADIMNEFRDWLSDNEMGAPDLWNNEQRLLFRLRWV